MAAVSTIASGKGGVGKSTLAAGLGASFARRGDRVLLIDADAGLRGLDYLLGVTEGLVFDIADIAEGRCEPLKAVYPCPSCAGLFLLPAQLGKPVAPRVMRMVVESLCKYFDRILLDSPAGVGSGFLSAAAPAQSAFLVATADPISIRGVGAVRRILAQGGIENCRLVLNRFDSQVFFRSGAYRDLDEVIDIAGVQLLGIVPEDGDIPFYAAKGVPMARKGGAADAFMRIAARIEGEDVPLPTRWEN